VVPGYILLEGTENARMWKECCLQILQNAFGHLGTAECVYSNP